MGSCDSQIKRIKSPLSVAKRDTLIERDRIRKRKRKIEKNSKERVRQVDQSKKGHSIGRERAVGTLLFLDP